MNTRRMSIWVWVSVFFILVTFNTFFDYSFFFKTYTVPTGDAASNDILITWAKHCSLFHGNYSRIGFYHPGPYYFQLMAIGEILFYDTFHFLISYNAAHIFTIMVWNSLCLTIYLRSWFTLTQSFFYAILSLILTLSVIFWTTQTNFILNDWPPDMYISSALLLISALINMWILGSQWLPLLVFASLQLIHGHGSFLAIAPIMMICAFIFGLAFKKFEGFRNWKKSLLFSLIIMVIFLIPLILQTILHWPGEIPSYFSKRFHHHLIEICKYFLNFFPLGGIWLSILLLRKLSSNNKIAENIWQISLLLVSTSFAAIFFYIAFGIDFFEYNYLLFWFSAFVGAILAGCLLYLFISLKNKYVKLIVLLTTLLLAIPNLAFYHHLPQSSSGDNFITTLNTLFKNTPNGKIELQLNKDPKYWTDVWSNAITLIALMNRQNKDFLCIDPDSWAILFHKRYECNSTDKITKILYIKR